jgi:Asp-tRNA(Asn)/Glu-tRNA(Gln) amidotransferase A subunit family amidase
MDDLTFLSAVEMAQQVREKKIAPVELAEAHLAKIEKTESEVECLRAFGCGARSARSPFRPSNSSWRKAGIAAAGLNRTGYFRICARKSERAT